MSFLGNVIWFIFGGLITCIGFFIGGFGLCLTIVGIPFGIQSFKLGIASLTPFGREVVENGPQANSPLRVIFNVIWIVLLGWELAVSHLVHAAILAITIIGLPFAKQHLKLIPLSLMPFGRDLLKA
jgi:uncharacterized membrane protein YccF (DUF307 family)